MSTQNRRLVQRSRNAGQPSPAPRAQQRPSAVAAQPLELPEYEPPSFPLSQAARAKIENLRIEGGTLKYKKSIATAISAISEVTPQCHERVHERREQLKKMDARRRNNEDDEDLAKEYNDLENYTRQLSKNIDKETELADQALRELIDYGEELAMQDTRIKNVIETVTAAAAAQPAPRRRRPRNEDEDVEEEPEDEEEDGREVLSTANLLREAHDEYMTTYVSRSLRARYGENNDYKRFKQGIHEATNQGENAPMMPHARTWFPEENNSNNGSSSRRRQTNNQDEESDDDIQIAGVTAVTKCPLTLKFFEEPYSNNICKHIFEKSAILDYINTSGSLFTGVGSNGIRESVKRAKCPQAGCEQMLAAQDFQDDILTLNKVKRQKRREEEAAQPDDDMDDHAPRGTQVNRPQNVEDDGSDGVDIEATPARRDQEMARIKRERHQSRGASVAPKHQPDPDVDMEDLYD